MSYGAYLFNMSGDKMYLTVNGGPQQTVAELGATVPYMTLGAPYKLMRIKGGQNERDHFCDKNRFSWYYENDSNSRLLEGVGVPDSWDVELDVQVYIFKNSLMVRYGDNAVYFSGSGKAQPA